MTLMPMNHTNLNCFLDTLKNCQEEFDKEDTDMEELETIQEEIAESTA